MLAGQADATRRYAECIESEALAIAEPTIEPDHVPAACCYVALVEATACHEVGMMQEHEAMDVVVGSMEPVRAYLACFKAEDG